MTPQPGKNTGKKLVESLSFHLMDFGCCNQKFVSVFCCLVDFVRQVLIYVN